MGKEKGLAFSFISLSHRFDNNVIRNLTIYDDDDTRPVDLNFFGLHTSEIYQFLLPNVRLVLSGRLITVIIKKNHSHSGNVRQI